MQLGIVVTDTSQSNTASCLIEEALGRDWSVRCFLTDDGANMLKNEHFISLANNPALHLSVCEHSAALHCKDLNLREMNSAVVVGGQYQDAELVRNSELVLVF